jgi:hypothetical protein
MRSSSKITEIQGRRPCEDRGMDCSDIATSQGMPKIAKNHAQGEHSPVNILISDFRTVRE